MINVSAQKKISGELIAANKLMHPATIQIKGTTSGTVINKQNTYFIFAEPGDSLTFTSLGYKSMIKSVGNDSIINFLPETDSNYPIYFEQNTIRKQNIKIPSAFKGISYLLKNRVELNQYDKLISEDVLISLDGVLIDVEEFKAVTPSMIEKLIVLQDQNLRYLHEKRPSLVLIKSKDSIYSKMWIQEFRHRK